MRSKHRRTEYLYVIGYVIFSLLRAVNNSLLQFKVPERTTFIVHCIILGILLLSFFSNKKFTIRYFAVIIGLASVALMVYIFNPNVDLLCIIFLIILAPYVDPNKIIKAAIFVNSFAIISVYILCRIGYIDDLLYRHISFAGISSAHSYGFVYYSTAPFMICFLSCMILCYHRNLSTYIILTIINIGAYVAFTAILPMVSYIMMLGFSVLAYKTNFYIKQKKWIVYLPFIFSVLSIILSLLYNPNNRIMSMLDNIFNTRISQGKTGLYQYGISVFGKPIEMFGSYKVTYAWTEGISNFFIDNDYLYLLLAYGIIFYLVVLVFYSKMLKTFISNNNLPLIIWTMTTIVFAFVNSTLVSIDFNPIILIGANQIISKKYQNSIEMNNSMRLNKKYLHVINGRIRI